MEKQIFNLSAKGGFSRSLNLTNADEVGASKTAYFENLHLFGGENGSNNPPATGTAEGAEGECATAAKGDVAPWESNSESNTESNSEGNSESADGDNGSSEFDNLIHGRYKKEYSEKVEEIVKRRLKGTGAKLEAANGIISRLCNHFGAENGEGLLAMLEEAEKENDGNVKGADSVENNDSTGRDSETDSAADIDSADIEAGTDRHDSTDDGDVEPAEEEIRAFREYSMSAVRSWIKGEENIKRIIPAFDLKAELENPVFAHYLVKMNLSVEDAFLLANRDGMALAFARSIAKGVEKRLAGGIASGRRRAAENGSTSRAAAVSRGDPSKMSDEAFEDALRRVANGERVSFG